MDRLREYLDQARGRRKKLASDLGISASAISMWDRVPAERVVDVERATGIPRGVLRPDLYDGNPVSPAVPAEAAP